MTAAAEPRSIEPSRVYPLAEFMDLSGLGVWAMRQARRKGLVVRYVGGRGFVRGSDFAEFVEKHGSPAKGSKA